MTRIIKIYDDYAQKRQGFNKFCSKEWFPLSSGRVPLYSGRTPLPSGATARFGGGTNSMLSFYPLSPNFPKTIHVILKLNQCGLFYQLIVFMLFTSVQYISNFLQRKAIVLFCVLCLASLISSAQLNFDFQQGKFLIKGRVIDVQSQKPVALANIRIGETNKGITCDNEGAFAFYVYKHDTLKFTSTGYMNKTLHIADLDSTQYYTLEIQLIRDFVKLREVTIYPFRNKEEFEEAFMDAKDINKITIAGIAPPKYSNVTPKAKFTNPISFIYEHLKKRRAANPDFKP